MGYWGYPNGQIPLERMDLYRGVLLRSDAARQAYGLQDAYMKATGKPLVILEGYRDLTRQKYLRNLYLSGRGNIAAVPGLSNHGWGLACDFAAPLNSSGSAEHRWMRQNAPLWGFDWGRGKADNEPWHWEYGNVRASYWAALDKTEIDVSEYKDWSNTSKDMMFFDIWGGGRAIPNYKGEQVSPGVMLAAVDQRIQQAWDELTPGVEGVKSDGRTYEQARLSQERTYQIIKMVEALGTLQFTDKQLATIGSGVKPIDEDRLVTKIINGVKALFGRAAA